MAALERTAAVRDFCSLEPHPARNPSAIPCAEETPRRSMEIGSSCHTPGSASTACTSAGSLPISNSARGTYTIAAPSVAHSRAAPSFSSLAGERQPQSAMMPAASSVIATMGGLTDLDCANWPGAPVWTANRSIDAYIQASISSPCSVATNAPRDAILSSGMSPAS